MTQPLEQEQQLADPEPKAKRPNYLYLHPFDENLRKLLFDEARHIGVSGTQYIQGILLGSGLRGRAKVFSSYQQGIAMRAAREAIEQSRKRNSDRRSIRD